MQPEDVCRKIAECERLGRPPARTIRKRLKLSGRQYRKVLRIGRLLLKATDKQ